MKALISVYDKTGVEKLAEVLTKKGYELVSSGGTYKFLKEKGFNVSTVEDVTGFPEMLDGRVKTLHPKIHGGLLALRNNEEHMDTIKKHSIDTIDVLCVNLYPFIDKLKENLSFDEMIEFIDIGGPSMLRSASKNFMSVSVLSNPKQYDEFLERLNNDNLTVDYRKSLAKAVFKLTSEYDLAISNYLSDGVENNIQNNLKNSFSFNEVPETLPNSWNIGLEKVRDLRYGENPHQKGAFYKVNNSNGFMLDCEQLNGKDLGYINYKDMEAAWTIVCDFEEPCASAIKHNTPCGVAIGEDGLNAYKKCFECDPVSIFGGIVAINREVDEETAKELTSIMLHMVCAPSFSEKALEILRKKKNLIVMKMNSKPSADLSIISCDGGVLIQEVDKDLFKELKVVTKRQPSKKELEELKFAMKVVKFVKSNAIAVTNHGMAIGIGGGYVNRIDAASYALKNAVEGSVLASDAFFPFSDVVEEAFKRGIKAIIQPGGSINDEDSIKKCDEYDMTMVFTSMRHFRH